MKRNGNRKIFREQAAVSINKVSYVCVEIVCNMENASRAVICYLILLHITASSYGNVLPDAVEVADIPMESEAADKSLCDMNCTIHLT